MKLRYTERALDEPAATLAYVVERSPRGATKIRSRTRRIEQLISDYPEVGRRTRLPGLRRIEATPYPYFILYEIASDEIVIHRVRHAARDPRGEGRS